MPLAVEVALRVIGATRSLDLVSIVLPVEILSAVVFAEVELAALQSAADGKL